MDETGNAQSGPNAAGPGRLSKLTHPVTAGTGLDLPPKTLARIAAAVPREHARIRRSLHDQAGATTQQATGTARSGDGRQGREGAGEQARAHAVQTSLPAAAALTPVSLAERGHQPGKLAAASVGETRPPEPDLQWPLTEC